MGVSKCRKREESHRAGRDQGRVVAWGFSAGGAWVGVVGAVGRVCEEDWCLSDWASSDGAGWTGLVMYRVLIGYFGWYTLRAKKEE